METALPVEVLPRTHSHVVLFKSLLHSGLLPRSACSARPPLFPSLPATKAGRPSQGKEVPRCRLRPSLFPKCAAIKTPRAQPRSRVLSVLQSRLLGWFCRRDHGAEPGHWEAGQQEGGAGQCLSAQAGDPHQCGECVPGQPAGQALGGGSSCALPAMAVRVIQLCGRQ